VTYPLPLGPEGLSIPAHSGCELLIPRADHYPLVGVFRLTLEPTVCTSVEGAQRDGFQTYIGPGEMGIFEPLMHQLHNRYSSREDRIPLSIPSAANCLIVKFPPMAGAAYVDPIGGPYLNANRPTGSSYRLVDEGDHFATGITSSAAFPLDSGWREPDHVSRIACVPLIEHPHALASPQHILPAEIAYNPCFTQGNCSTDVLEQIHSAEMTLEILHLSVTRPTRGGQWVSLRTSGPTWFPARQVTPPASASRLREHGSMPAARGASGAILDSNTVNLPLISAGSDEFPQRIAPVDGLTARDECWATSLTQIDQAGDSRPVHPSHGRRTAAPSCGASQFCLSSIVS